MRQIQSQRCREGGQELYPALPPRQKKPPRTYPVCSAERAMELIRTECGPVRVRERQGKGRNKVILLPEAAQELTAIVSYGRRSPMNASEQKFTGLGHFLATEEGDVLVVVSHFIELQTMNRSPVSASNLGPNGEYNPGLDFLEYHREEYIRWEKKYNRAASGHLVDPFLGLCGHSEFVLEGHTHPDLGVFYSGTDRESGAARAASLPVCIFVCDPVRREMLGSIGKDFRPAEVIVFAAESTEKAAEPRAKAEEQEEQLPPPAEEIVRLTSRCLQRAGYSGSVRQRTRLRGGSCLKIRLNIPRS